MHACNFRRPHTVSGRKSAELIRAHTNLMSQQMMQGRSFNDRLLLCSRHRRR